MSQQKWTQDELNDLNYLIQAADKACQKKEIPLSTDLKQALKMEIISDKEAGEIKSEFYRFVSKNKLEAELSQELKTDSRSRQVAQTIEKAKDFKQELKQCMAQNSGNIRPSEIKKRQVKGKGASQNVK